MMRISELRHKDVIDNTDGRRLGYIRDVEINVDKGLVEALVIPEDGRWFGLFRQRDDRIVSWTQIAKIGVDVILIVPPSAGVERRRTTKKEAEQISPTSGIIINDEFDDADFFRFD